jgi:hypothetical protein
MNRGSILGACLLIGMGVLFLIFNIVGISMDKTWPIIFFAIGAVFFLPPMLWPSARAGLAGLCIPGANLISLGCIFLYNTITNDWASWSYAWILIPASVGLGLTLASWLGGWGRHMASIGWWMFIISVVVFSIFATLFGGPTLKVASPVVVILFGVWLMIRSFRK